MTKSVLTKVFLLVLIAVVGLSLALAVIRQRRKQKLVWHPGTVPRSNDSNDLRPLKEKAKQNSRYVGYQSPTSAKSNDVAELAHRSALVIVGVPQTNISRLSADGQTITLDYTLKVESGQFILELLMPAQQY